MSASQSDPAAQPQLKDLSIKAIDPNEDNPRLVFPQDELDKLAESIDQEGILVPVVVYAKGDRYVLVDGERRFRCAQLLGLKIVPALIVSERPKKDVLLQMFNIHLVREPWRDMPTAIALDKLFKELEANGEDSSDKRLGELTGLSIERVRQLRYVMTLPEEWRQYIQEGQIPLNFFWELKRNVVDALAKQRPKLFAELGGADAIAQAIVDKRLSGVITDTVGLRQIRPIINFAEADAGDQKDAPSVLDASLRSLFVSPELSIDEVYEDTVQIMVEADKLQRRTGAMLTSFERLLQRARTPEERKQIIQIGKAFIAALSKLLK